MSFTKRHLEEVQESEAMREWIIDQGDMFMVEGDEQWQELEEQYLSGDIYTDTNSPSDWDDDYYESEINWTKEQKAFPTFKSQIEEVRKKVNKGSSKLTLKMNYSFSVTLMESCLGDMLRGVIFQHPSYLLNAIKNVDELKKCKVTLIEVYENEDLVLKVILKTLSKEYTYHHIQRTVSIYENVLTQPLPDSIKSKIGEMKNIIDIRHDIVHRNGFTTDDIEHEITYVKARETIDNIFKFVAAMKDYIDSTEVKRVLASLSVP